MAPSYEAPLAFARKRSRLADRGTLTGVLVVLATTAVAEPLGLLLPMIGAPALALLLGMAVRLRYAPDTSARVVIRFASSNVLKGAVVVLGATFGLGEVAHIGRSSLPLMLGTLVIALAAAWLVGRALGVDSNLQTLVGVGTAICGASAIGAVSGVIGAVESEIAYAISTIFVFNVVAVVLYPALGHLLSLSQHSFGLWAGTAINDTSSVVAATATYGSVASSYGVVVKLTRALMIVPICAWLASRRLKKMRSDAESAATTMPRWWKLVPWFIGYFLLAVVANTIGLVPHRWHADLSDAATYLITVALVGVGLSARFDEMRRSGLRPLALGAALWATVGISSLALQAIFR